MHPSLKLKNSLARHAARGYLPWNSFRGTVETVESFLARPEVDGETFVLVSSWTPGLAVRPVDADYVIVNLVKAPEREHSHICNCSRCCPRDVEIIVETR